MVQPMGRAMKHIPLTFYFAILLIIGTACAPGFAQSNGSDPTARTQQGGPYRVRCECGGNSISTVLVDAPTYQAARGPAEARCEAVCSKNAAPPPQCSALRTQAGMAQERLKVTTSQLNGSVPPGQGCVVYPQRFNSYSVALESFYQSVSKFNSSCLSPDQRSLEQPKADRLYADRQSKIATAASEVASKCN